MRDTPPTQPLMQLRWLVHAVEVNQVLEYRVYAMRTRLTGGQILAAGRLSETIRAGNPPGSSPLMNVIAGMPAGQAALIDESFQLLFGQFIPLNPADFKIVPARVLSNATETAVLVIPVTATGGLTHAPQGSGRYRLDFAIDRVRFRADTPDAVSNYRASASIIADWRKCAKLGQASARNGAEE